MNKVEQGRRRYIAELGGATLLFIAAMSVRKTLTASLPEGDWLRDGVILLPIVPICLAAWAIVRLYRHTDEMHQRLMLENIAFAALISAIGSLGLGLLQDAGFPMVSIGWAWPLLAVGWLSITAWRGLQDLVASRRE